MSLKTNVAIFFGGASVEHDISVLTGLQVINAIDNSIYNIYPIYIDRDGKWFLKRGVKDVFSVKRIKGKRVFLMGGDSALYSKHKKICDIHVALLAMHGRLGEDGALQGILECSGIPYTSSNIKASAITMDKIAMKKFFEVNNLPVLNYFTVSSNEWINEREKIFYQALKMGYPLIVKPSGLGSSIGISKAQNENELNSAIELALSYDKNLLIERAVQNLVEVNVACFSYKGAIMVSELERPIKNDEILSFNDKYRKNGKGAKDINSNGMASLTRIIPADIDNDLYIEIVEYVKKAYKVFNCSGVIRCDFIIENNTVYLNEINSIPGSLAFYLWEAKGIKFKNFINMLIDDSLWRKQNDNCIKVFRSGLLS